MKFNEDSRVKIPSILHLTRLNYDYLSLRDASWDENTNIFTDIFKSSIGHINPDLDSSDVSRLLEDATLALDNEDIGKAFYEMLTSRSGAKLIDFENFDNNTFNVVTELTYKNGDEEFRPDVILLINGMPLVFIEVKKPNNKEGILAEQKRIKVRFKNDKFRRFVNITQLMVFSNNMEYDDESPLPIEGAFYASSSYSNPIFNYFREERRDEVSASIKELDDAVENFVLKDNNLTGIKHSPEFTTNKHINTPTNRILTSLFSRNRLAFILRYSLAYVNDTLGIQKHVMRYPQLFASQAIKKKLEEGIRKGIIWHTQGSGKTALAYYNVSYLTDYFHSKKIVPKFYFIVDRIDLLTQAHREFRSRGLKVHTINSREGFAKDIKTNTAIHNLSGKPEITVVNIQRFADDPDVVKTKDYDVGIQRVYFLDEVHRSYNPKGSFLANLNQSDPDAIKIGLTGTPLLGDDYNSKSLFGDYIHKYYYDSSIADGYTLRLIREDIQSNYKMALRKALDEVEVIQGDGDKKLVYAHHKFVEPMLDYVVTDFEFSRTAMADSSIGAMVICDSNEQAEKMYEIFQAKYGSITPFETDSYDESLKEQNRVKTAALILHDAGTKTDRKDLVDEFKAGKIDLLIVNAMLLTGFDAPRLKKLYVGRVIKKHNLLQALTRVNRSYKEFRYGYVVDFADIRSEFKAANEAYFKELQEELGDEMQHYSNLFKSQEEIEQDIESIKDILFKFNTENAELFSQQITQIQDKQQVLEIKKALNNAKVLYNLIRLSGNFDLLDKLDFQKINVLYREVSNHLDNLNLKDNLANSTLSSNLLNAALEDVVFQFTKIGEEELILADKLKNTLRKTREGLAGNFDPKDPEFISLKEELERLFHKKKLSEVSQEAMHQNIDSLNDIYDRVQNLNRRNEMIRMKYNNDKKYARIHKRLMENGDFKGQERRVFEALMGVKQLADERVLLNAQVLNNESYFQTMLTRVVIDQFKTKQHITLTPDSSKFINGLVVREYMNEFNGVSEW
ncbi:type I restriction enzyme, R subunit [Mariprofundus micogutta]|uniref:type I site-specific deoxyribonuclease n=1 Tax=Mariprofundus micogutta TaxID=1921010 RepID=A0A1L8CR81_9PROT|nr:type I restriction endonuclease [Mariprofundus micogutta]GAV21431.1 type I restriction enzyme, R subunit [Mariprofundus micogutta]